MRLIVTSLLILTSIVSLGQSTTSQLKKPDPSIIWRHTSTFSPSSGSLPEESCPIELKIAIIISLDQKEKMAIPLKGYHYVNGILRDSLELVEHAEVRVRDGEPFKGSPFYYIISVGQDKNLHSKSLHNVLIKPEATQIVQNNKVTNARSIYITVPFEHSPAEGPIKINSYEFVLGNKMYDLNLGKYLDDPDLSNNKIHIDHYRRCFAEGILVPVVDEEDDGIEKSKLIEKVYPNEVKGGEKLSVVITKTFDEKPVDINKVQIKIVDPTFNEVLYPTEMDLQTNTFTFQTSSNTIYHTPNICFVFYDGEIDIEKVIIKNK